MGLQNLEDEESVIREVSSCLRGFATTTALASVALINFWPTPNRELPENLAQSVFLLPKRLDAQESDHRDHWDVSSSWERHDCISNADPMEFEHMGPGSNPPGTTHSSDISLPSQGFVTPALTQTVVQISKDVAPIELNRDASESVKPELESLEAAR